MGLVSAYISSYLSLSNSTKYYKNITYYYYYNAVVVKLCIVGKQVIKQSDRIPKI